MQKLVSLWEEQPGLLGQESGRRSAPLPSSVLGVLPAALPAQPSTFPAQLLTSLPSALASPGKTFKHLLGPSAAPAQHLRGALSLSVLPAPRARGGVLVSSLHPLRLCTAWWITIAVSKSKHRNQHTCWERALADAGVLESSYKAFGGDG